MLGWWSVNCRKIEWFCVWARFERLSFLCVWQFWFEIYYFFDKKFFSWNLLFFSNWIKYLLKMYYKKSYLCEFKFRSVRKKYFRFYSFRTIHTIHYNTMDSTWIKIYISMCSKIITDRLNKVFIQFAQKKKHDIILICKTTLTHYNTQTHN